MPKPGPAALAAAAFEDRTLVNTTTLVGGRGYGGDTTLAPNVDHIINNAGNNVANSGTPSGINSGADNNSNNNKGTVKGNRPAPPARKPAPPMPFTRTLKPSNSSASLASAGLLSATGSSASLNQALEQRDLRGTTGASLSQKIAMGGKTRADIPSEITVHTKDIETLFMELERELDKIQ